jgi:5'-nucleotidase
MRIFRPGTAAALLASLFIVSGCATRPAAPLEVNLVALNDFHGHLEPSKFEYTSAVEKQSATVQAGGIVNLGAALQAWRKEDPSLLLVGAGDLIGASPAISSLWADEPTINALNLLGMNVSSVGNHEFDAGRVELLRQQKGGCASPRPDKACKADPQFKGAGFSYLAANVIDTATGAPVLPAFRIEEVKGVKIAFIGAVLKGTASVVVASGIEGLSFVDEVPAINAAVPLARAAGATVFVVLIHQGGDTEEAFDQANCSKLRGPIVGIARRLDPAIRLIVSGHTHKGYQCKVDERVITQAQMGGHVATRIKLTIDPVTHELRDTEVHNTIIKKDQYPENPVLTAYLKDMRALSADSLARPVARVAVRSITRKYSRGGESPLGDLITDGILDAARSEGVQVAFMNPGGMRKDLDVTNDLTANFGHAQAVLPFSNWIVVLEMTGAQIADLLEQQWRLNLTEPSAHLLQVSRGFSYRWTEAPVDGHHVVAGSMKLDGVPLDPAQTYRVGVNNFLGEGGDGFPQFAKVPKRDTQILDLDALIAHLVKHDREGRPAGTETVAGRIERAD